MIDLTFFLAVYGAALALTVLQAGEPYRWAGERVDRWVLRRKNNAENPGPFTTLTNCPACTSFWVGLPSAYFWHSPSGFFVADAFACVGIVWMIHVTLTKLGQKEM